MSREDAKIAKNCQGLLVSPSRAVASALVPLCVPTVFLSSRLRGFA